MCGAVAGFSGTDKTLRFAGKQLKKYENFERNDIWVEFRCNREDKHDLIGEHYHKCTYLSSECKLTWVITEDDLGNAVG